MQRNTEQRKIILSELAKRKDHPSADEVYTMVKKKLPKISLGTVYRNLEKMVSCGLVLKLDYSSSQSRFDPNVIEHPHFRCMSCGKVEDIPEEALDYKNIPSFNKMSQWYKTRDIKMMNLEYCGLCKECKEKNQDIK